MKKDDRRNGRRRNSFLPLAIGTTGGVALATLAFWFFKEQADNVVQGKADRYDDLIMEAVHTIGNPAMNRTMTAVTQLGSHAVISTAAGLTAIALVRAGRKQDAWTIAVSTGGAMVINTVLKNIFQRQRPIEMARQIKLPRSHSFPSGHSLLSAATYPIVVQHLVQKRSTRTILIAHSISGALIISVGFSRVYFGVHFPSDVLGGFAAGLGWLGLTSLSYAIGEPEQP